MGQIRNIVGGASGQYGRKLRDYRKGGGRQGNRCFESANLSIRRLEMKNKGYLFLAMGICLVLAFSTLPFRAAYAADPIEMKAVAFLPTKTHQTKFFVEYIEEVQKRSQGQLKIKFLGGPEVIRSREQVDALQSGLVQIALIPPSYYAKQIPAVTAKYFSGSILDQRKNGFFDIMAELTETINMRYLGEVNPTEGMYMMTNFMVKDPRTDFKGRKIRIVSTYDRLVKSLGAAGTVVPRVEIYTGMERGVIEAFFANAIQVLQLGLVEVVKYLVHPLMFPGGCLVNANLAAWNKLPKDIQKVFLDTIIEKEKKWQPLYGKMDEEARAKLREKGIKEIRFSPEDEKWYVDLANGEWDDVVKADPVNGKKMRKIVLGY
jgi:TRAP-type C4-dicarboxylate transport system substrate-binding protein